MFWRPKFKLAVSVPEIFVPCVWELDTRDFRKLYKVGYVGYKGLHREEQTNLAKILPVPLDLWSNVLMTELIKYLVFSLNLWELNKAILYWFKKW